jgi:hypothetical protein
MTPTIAKFKLERKSSPVNVKIRAIFDLPKQHAPMQAITTPRSMTESCLTSWHDETHDKFGPVPHGFMTQNKSTEALLVRLFHFVSIRRIYDLRMTHSWFAPEMTSAQNADMGYRHIQNT